MSRIFVLGTGPLLEEDGAKLVSGQCLRTLHFVRPLLAAGHQVTLATVPIPGTEDTPDKFSRKTCNLKTDTDSTTSIRYTALGCSASHLLMPWLNRKLKNKKHDAIVGVNPWPACLLSDAKSSVPFWADLNGYTMAEGQTRAKRVGNDLDLHHFWSMELKTLLAADRFSTVTQRQTWALMGELAMAGRLTGATFAEEFSVSVPNAVYALYANLDRVPLRSTKVRQEILARLFDDSVPPSASLVLWSGGFNTWTDVDMLVQALSIVLKEKQDLHFIATGGAVSGHDDVTFVRFQELVKEHLPMDRVHLPGWIETGDVVDLHRIAHVGINVDSKNTETMFGARNRLTNMIGAGMPVVTTQGTEIAEWMAQQGVGKTTPVGNAELYAGAILDIVSHQAAEEKQAKKHRELALKEFAPANTLKDFLAWCEHPVKSSDRSKPESDVSRRLRPILDGTQDAWATDSASLAILRQKLPLRAWRHLKKILRGQ